MGPKVGGGGSSPSRPHPQPPLNCMPKLQDSYLQVVTDNLTYNRTDYDGEVFRMNIVCDNNDLVNCVFFKLNGTTDLRKGS